MTALEARDISFAYPASGWRLGPLSLAVDEGSLVGDPGAVNAGALWRQTATLSVRRAVPSVTTRGKHLSLVLAASRVAPPTGPAR